MFIILSFTFNRRWIIVLYSPSGTKQDNKGLFSICLPSSRRETESNNWWKSSVFLAFTCDRKLRMCMFYRTGRRSILKHSWISSSPWCCINACIIQSHFQKEEELLNSPDLSICNWYLLRKQKRQFRHQNFKSHTDLKTRTLKNTDASHFCTQIPSPIWQAFQLLSARDRNRWIHVGRKWTRHYSIKISVFTVFPRACVNCWKQMVVKEM